MEVIKLIPKTDKEAAHPWNHQQVREVTIEKIRQLPYRYLICFYLGVQKQCKLITEEAKTNYTLVTVSNDLYWKSFVAERCLIKELRKRSIDNLKTLALADPQNPVSKALLGHLEAFESE
jgi:hypothetical protein